MKIDFERPMVIETMELSFESTHRLRLSGTVSTTTAQERIERVLAEVHSHVLTANLASFTVDVRGLEFVNSSALRVFINWISRAERARYKLVFVTDPKVTWHRLNFSVLKSLSPHSVEIERGRSGTG